MIANSERKIALSQYCTLRFERRRVHCKHPMHWDYLQSICSNIANPKVPPQLYNMAHSLRSFVQQLLCKVPDVRLGGEWWVALASRRGKDWGWQDRMEYTQRSIRAFASSGFWLSLDYLRYSTWWEIVAWLSRVMWVLIAARGGVEEVMKDSFFSGVDWKVPFNKLIAWFSKLSIVQVLTSCSEPFDDWTCAFVCSCCTRRMHRHPSGKLECGARTQMSGPSR